jgi:hypothetical protein
MECYFVIKEFIDDNWLPLSYTVSEKEAIEVLVTYKRASPHSVLKTEQLDSPVIRFRHPLQ